MDVLPGDAEMSRPTTIHEGQEDRIGGCVVLLLLLMVFACCLLASASPKFGRVSVDV